MADTTLREKADRQLAAMKGIRNPYEADWREIAELALPSRMPFLHGTGNAVQTPVSGTGVGYSRPKRRANKATHDSHPRRASRTLTAGMASGMSSSVTPWFKLIPSDRELREHQPVKEWLSDVELSIYDLFASTNFYDAVKVNYAELGCFGVSASVMMQHLKYGAVTHPLTAGEFWLAADEGRRVDTLYRRVLLTVRQCMMTFPRERLSRSVQNAWSSGNYETLVPIIHAIEPNDEFEGEFEDNANMAYRSVMWEEGVTDKSRVLAFSGFRDKPFWAPRWETRGHEVYSDSAPGFDALPDMRELQLTARQRGRAKDNVVKPPMKAPVGLRGSPISLDSGTITYVDNLSAETLSPLIETQYQAIGALREDQYELRRDVDECFYVDLFRMISEREGVQPLNDLEASLRNDEKFTQIGPVVDRVNVEMLEYAVDRAYSILEDTNALPPTPKELQGRALTVDFVSILAQAQRSASNAAIERVARYVGFIGGMYPEAVLKFDAEQSIDEFATGIGAPPRIVRSDEIVEKLRNQMAQQQQQQQLAETAGPLRDVATAAKTLSETDTGNGQTALEQVAAAA